MNKRHEELLRLLGRSGKPVSAAELARRLGVSLRSVKSYVAQINTNGRVVASGPQGYSLLAPAAGLTPGAQTPAPQSYEERSVFIIKRLLIERRYVDIYALAEALFISDSTCRADLSRMNKTYADFSLKFAVEHDFPQIKGAERDKRRLIRHVIAAEAKGEFLSASRIESLFPVIDIPRLAAVLNAALKDTQPAINDFSKNYLLFSLAIVLIRVGSNQYLTQPADRVAKRPAEYALAQRLTREIEEAFGVRFTPQEQEEIYFLLLTSLGALHQPGGGGLTGFVGEPLIAFLHESLAAIRQHYFIDFDRDSFFAPFSLHIKKLLLRAKKGETVDNPLTASIKQQYPLIYDISIFFYGLFQKQYNMALGEDEVAFFAIHFGGEVERQTQADSEVRAALLCPDYLDLQEKLARQLEAEFTGKLRLIHTTGDASSLPDDVQLLITTLPAPATALPVVEISVFLGPKDKVAVFYALQQILEQQTAPSVGEVVARYFSPLLFFAGQTHKTRQECLQFLCGQLQQLGYVGADFYEGILHREQLASTAFQGLALPHSLTAQAQKTGICLYLPRDGIQWDAENRVHLVLLAAVAPQDRRAFGVAYDTIARIFSNFDLLRQVGECQSFEDFTRRLALLE